MWKKYEGKIVGFVSYAVLTFLCISIIFPFLQVITISVSPNHVINKAGFHFLPTELDWTGYETVFKNRLIWIGYKNTIIRTILSVVISMLVTIMAAYPLSKKVLPNRQFWLSLFVFTMYFSGGMIPTYLLIKNLNLLNTVWSLVLPGAVGVYNMIIIRNFFEALPDELEESAKLDGATAFQILFLIVLPLSKAVMATVALWITVASWNEWFNCMIYIHREDGYVLQYVLHKILAASTDMGMESIADDIVSSEAVEMASIIVTILPILCLYPFLQKYFVKGVMLGSVKG